MSNTKTDSKVKDQEAQPITDKRKVAELLRVLREQAFRDYMLFFFGLNTHLRITEILKHDKIHPTRVKHIRNDKGKIRDYYVCKTKNTSGEVVRKKRKKIGNELRKELNKYLNAYEMEQEDFLWFSLRYPHGPLDRTNAWRRFKKAGEKLDLDVKTHTMRKTAAYHLYQDTKDIRLVMNVLGHYRVKDTLAYIGVTQEMEDDALEDHNWKALD